MQEVQQLLVLALLPHQQLVGSRSEQVQPMLVPWAQRRVRALHAQQPLPPPPQQQQHILLLPVMLLLVTVPRQWLSGCGCPSSHQADQQLLVVVPDPTVVQRM
jgi:hypothetical protein